MSLGLSARQTLPQCRSDLWTQPSGVEPSIVIRRQLPLSSSIRIAVLAGRVWTTWPCGEAARRTLATCFVRVSVAL